MIENKILRLPTELEIKFFDRLPEADFPGKIELKQLLHGCEVCPIDNYGSLKIFSKSELNAPVIQRIPIEAFADDNDKIRINLLLHVLDGKPVELEFYKDDGSDIQQMPEPSLFKLLLLGP